MKNLLAGNGVIIQFGGSDYLNSSIVRRAITNVKTGNFPSHLYPAECAKLLYGLQQELTKVVYGEYDKFATTSYIRSSLDDFKRRYGGSQLYEVHEIGFEDYFLIFELFHVSRGISNPDRFNSRGVFRRMFLDSVYNGGKIELVYRSFATPFVHWVRSHDNVFTTNYDSNLDVGCGVDVHHLHGCFKTLSESYDPNSFRNQLTDDLLDGEKVDFTYPYLYSNALVSYVGELKEYAMSQSTVANSGMEKFANGYRDDPAMREQIDAWPEDDDLTRRLKEAIRLKADNPDLKHGEQYPHQMLSEISGTLRIVGLSPSNDGHLFSRIHANDKILDIVFYCFGEQEAEDAKNLFRGRRVEVVDVREHWAHLGCS
ncbi:MAG: hypothetical protein KDA88_02390 [Planctomycetaceae bacterium]|nr:hypothetical protein [Planctomycetaceae bacterium]MCB9952918.1 hypothetical protein [Planctomycetaceae bacterium]